MPEPGNTGLAALGLGGLIDGGWRRRKGATTFAAPFSIDYLARNSATPNRSCCPFGRYTIKDWVTRALKPRADHFRCCQFGCLGLAAKKSLLADQNEHRRTAHVARGPAAAESSFRGFLAWRHRRCPQPWPHIDGDARTSGPCFVTQTGPKYRAIYGNLGL